MSTSLSVRMQWPGGEHIAHTGETVVFGNEVLQREFETHASPCGANGRPLMKYIGLLHEPLEAQHCILTEAESLPGVWLLQNQGGYKGMRFWNEENEKVAAMSQGQCVQVPFEGKFKVRLGSKYDYVVLNFEVVAQREVAQREVAQREIAFKF